MKYAEDIALVERIIAGDRRAWAELVERHGATIRFAVQRTLGGRTTHNQPHVVDDLVADLILALASRGFRKLSRYSGRCSLRQWLKVVSSNFTIDHLRKQRPLVPIRHAGPDEEGDSGAVLLVDRGPDPHAQVERRELAEAIAGLFDKLCDDDRLFIELYYRRGLEYERVAELMGTTVGAIYARKTRLRRRLQKLAREAAIL